jgi:hypothetical protein
MTSPVVLIAFSSNTVLSGMTSVRLSKTIPYGYQFRCYKCSGINKYSYKKIKIL